MSMQILRPVTIKAKVTDGLKDRLSTEIRLALEHLQEEMQQLETQIKRAQLTAAISPQQQMQLRQLVEQEKAKRADRKAQLEDERTTIMSLPIGSEIVHGQAQSLTTIDVGSDFEELTTMEVLVEDGKVIAIRRGGA